MTQVSARGGAAAGGEAAVVEDGAASRWRAGRAPAVKTLQFLVFVAELHRLGETRKTHHTTLKTYSTPLVSGLALGALLSALGCGSDDENTSNQGVVDQQPAGMMGTREMPVPSIAWETPELQ